EGRGGAADGRARPRGGGGHRAGDGRVRGRDPGDARAAAASTRGSSLRGMRGGEGDVAGRPGRSRAGAPRVTGRVDLKLVVNGRARRVLVPPMKRLLDVLRQDLGLTGTKEGCGEGECGACTVLLDGVSVNSCLVPAFQADGQKVVTVEGLAVRSKLSRLQQAFVEMGAAQCGICTPGILVSARELLPRSSARVPSEADVHETLAGSQFRFSVF